MNIEDESQSKCVHFCEQIQRVIQNPQKVEVIFINEVVPNHMQDNFYASNVESEYAKAVESLFRNVDYDCWDVQALLERGIYFTNAVKEPKEVSTISKSLMQCYQPILEEELSMFPNVKVVMLMGDVAIKMFEAIKRKEKKKRVIPAGSTYKIRKGIFFDGDVRVFPSYIMTGRNLMIEKSKRVMIEEDVREMLQYWNDTRNS